MKDSRIGETLWSEWCGNDAPFSNSEAFIFYTEEHVDVQHDVVKRALASCIQRDGLVDSLGQAFSCIEGERSVTHGYAGYVDGDNELTFCDSDSMTATGDKVVNLLPITLVEFNV
jgi:hypothetical protein